jgi:hypothetical protein
MQRVARLTYWTIGKLCIVHIGYFEAMSKVVDCHNSKEYFEANGLSSLFVSLSRKSHHLVKHTQL